jgi:4-amino-4-deoxy-L-arabinose transferase-like glycosyltransferase
MFEKPKKSLEHKLNFSEKKYLFLIFMIALLMRSIVILFIYGFQDAWGTYFYLDDWKYETYSVIYGDIASKIFDIDAMKLAGQQIGGIAVGQFYFRLNAIIYYMTRSVVALRLMNAFFSSLTIVPIYLLTKELFSSKEAKIASWIFALLPYHIIMSAFLFKDILIVLFMSTALYMIIKYYKYGYIKILPFLAIILPTQWLRDGIPIFLIGILCLAFLFRNYKKRKVFLIALWIIIPVFSIVFVYIFSDTLLLLYSRFEIYMNFGREHSGGINIIRIDNLKQLYKLPLTWIFSTFFPITFGFEIDSWSALMGILNYSLFFLSPAYIFFTIKYKKNKAQKLFFLPLFLLHLLVIILVINVPRHYYFLHFYIIICSSAYLSSLKTQKKILNYILITMPLIISFYILMILLY